MPPPPKPWEQPGAAAAASSSSLAVATAAGSAATGALTTTTGAAALGSALPAASYGTGMGVGRYGMGSGMGMGGLGMGSSMYGGGLGMGSSMYGGGLGMGSSMYGGGLGMGSMYGGMGMGSMYGGMGGMYGGMGMGGMGMGMGGMPGMMPSEFEQRSQLTFMVFGRILEAFGMLAHVVQMVFGSATQFFASYVGLSQQMHTINQQQVALTQQQQQLAMQGGGAAGGPPMFVPRFPPGTTVVEGPEGPHLINFTSGEMVADPATFAAMMQQQQQEYAMEVQRYQQAGGVMAGGPNSVGGALQPQQLSMKAKAWIIFKRLALFAVAFYLIRLLWGRLTAPSVPQALASSAVGSTMMVLQPNGSMVPAAARVENALTSAEPHYHATTASWDGRSSDAVDASNAWNVMAGRSDVAALR